MACNLGNVQIILYTSYYIYQQTSDISLAKLIIWFELFSLLSVHPLATRRDSLAIGAAGSKLVLSGLLPTVLSSLAETDTALAKLDRHPLALLIIFGESQFLVPRLDGHTVVIELSHGGA